MLTRHNHIFLHIYNFQVSVVRTETKVMEYPKHSGKVMEIFNYDFNLIRSS